jgi:hypothetical protein
VNRVRVTIQDESYLTLDTVADCYECTIEMVEHIYGLGLLGPGEQIEGRTAIATRMLERLAEILRLCHYQGIDPTVVELFLVDEDGR